MIVGDFNATLTLANKMGGDLSLGLVKEDFHLFVQNNMLWEVPTKGGHLHGKIEGSVSLILQKD